MEWLEQNLKLAYPFADGVVDPVTSVFADALVSAPVDGGFSLSIFDPQALTNAHVQIKQGTSIILETGAATVTVVGAYTVLEGVDVARGSRYRFVVDTAKVAAYAFLPAPAPFVAEVCSFAGGVVSSLNGLTGDVVLRLPNFSDLTIVTEDDQAVVVGFEDPAARVDCLSADCAKLFTINGAGPDAFGSFVISPDGCYRLVPFAGQLYLYNFCTPCLKCEDLDTLNALLNTEAGYYYQMAAIYHDQFNRMQRGVAHANREIESVLARGIPVAVPTGSPPAKNFGGLVDLGGRSFNRPYFSQLALSVINSTPYRISVVLTVSLLPSAIASAWVHVPKSTILQRFATTGEQFPQVPDPGLPGAATFTVEPQETVAYSTEVHLQNLVNSAPAAGQWHVTAAVTFLSGPDPIPASATISRNFALGYIPAPPTAISP